MKNIKLERIKQNLIQEEIAKELDISINTYSKKENHGGFTDKELKILANKYKCSIDYLLEN